MERGMCKCNTNNGYMSISNLYSQDELQLLLLAFTTFPLDIILVVIQYNSSFLRRIKVVVYIYHVFFIVLLCISFIFYLLASIGISMVFSYLS